jgi:hypothetical protein
MSACSGGGTVTGAAQRAKVFRPARPAGDPHADTNANPTRHYADVWRCLRRVTACRRVLGWAGLGFHARCGL